MRLFIHLLIIPFLLMTLPVLASPLSEARDAGQVIELPTGYVRAADGADARIRKLVQEVNERRRIAYEKIASKNGVPVEVVAKESYIKRKGR